MGNMMWRARLSKHPNDDPEKSADLRHKLIVPRNIRRASGYLARIFLSAFSAASRTSQRAFLSAATKVGRTRLAASDFGLCGSRLVHICPPCGTVVWCGIRSKEIVQWASLSAAMFRERLISKAAQLALLPREARPPRYFVFKLGENLGGNGVLLILRQAGNLFEGLLQQLGHDTNLPDGPPSRNVPG